MVLHTILAISSFRTSAVLLGASPFAGNSSCRLTISAFVQGFSRTMIFHTADKMRRILRYAGDRNKLCRLRTSSTWRSTFASASPGARSRLKSRPPPVSVHSGDVQHCMTFYPTMNQDENRAAFGSTAGSSIDQDGSPKEHEQSSVPGPIRHNGPGRKPRACPPCKRLKMKCEALPGDASRCTRCARRGLVCQLSSVTFDDKSPQQTDYG